jgi:hypothetical protein
MSVIYHCVMSESEIFHIQCMRLIREIKFKWRMEIAHQTEANEKQIRQWHVLATSNQIADGTSWQW